MDARNSETRRPLFFPSLLQLSESVAGGFFVGVAWRCLAVLGVTWCCQRASRAGCWILSQRALGVFAGCYRAESWNHSRLYYAFYYSILFRVCDSHSHTSFLQVVDQSDVRPYISTLFRHNLGWSNASSELASRRSQMIVLELSGRLYSCRV